MKKIIKKHNHLYPLLHIRKWQSLNGKIYDKDISSIRDIDERDFTNEYYYSLGKKNDHLENRIQVFESYIGKLVIKIDESETSVYLTGKEIEILKLYCVLSACRQHHTSEVVLSDESGFYKSNNYIFGIHRVSKQEEAVKLTEQIMDDFDKIKQLHNDKQFCQSNRLIHADEIGSIFTVGTHLGIVRSSDKSIMVSDRCSVIENTMDGDHLYTYVPISPSSALLLIKTKYYLDLETYTNAKIRLAEKYMASKPDRYLSVIFGDTSTKNYEYCLWCSYYKYTSNVHVHPYIMLESRCYRSAHVHIYNLPSIVFRNFNAIFYQDGKKILYINQEELEQAKNLTLDYRHINLSPLSY